MMDINTKIQRIKTVLKDNPNFRMELINDLDDRIKEDKPLTDNQEKAVDNIYSRWKIEKEFKKLDFDSDDD